MSNAVLLADSGLTLFGWAVLVALVAVAILLLLAVVYGLTRFVKWAVRR